MWNSVESTCDWPVNVNCNLNGQTVDLATPPTATQASASTLPPKEFSSGQSQETGKLVVCCKFV